MQKWIRKQMVALKNKSQKLFCGKGEREQGDKGRKWLARQIKKKGEKIQSTQNRKENEAIVNLEAAERPASYVVYFY